MLIKAKPLNSFRLQCQMLSGGKIIILPVIPQRFHLKQKQAKELLAPFYVHRLKSVFLQTAATEQPGFPREKSSLSPRDSSIPNMSRSPTRGGRKEENSSLPAKIRFLLTSDRLSTPSQQNAWKGTENRSLGLRLPGQSDPITGRALWPVHSPPALPQVAKITFEYPF